MHWLMSEIHPRRERPLKKLKAQDFNDSTGAGGSPSATEHPRQENVCSHLLRGTEPHTATSILLTFGDHVGLLTAASRDACYHTNNYLSSSNNHSWWVFGVPCDVIRDEQHCSSLTLRAKLREREGCSLKSVRI